MLMLWFGRQKGYSCLEVGVYAQIIRGHMEVEQEMRQRFDQ